MRQFLRGPRAFVLAALVVSALVAYALTVQAGPGRAGGQVREYQVLVDPRSLAQQGLTIAQVSNALAASNLIRSVGRYTYQSQSFLVLVDATVPRPEAILDTVVFNEGTRLVRIRDLARVREGDEEVAHVVVAGYRDAKPSTC